MNKIVKIILIFIIADIMIIGGYFIFKTFSAGNTVYDVEDYEWVLIDETYSPRDYVESFIMQDSAAQGYFPVYIKNYGKNKKILRRFRGNKLANPNEAVLKMMHDGLEDWKIIDLKYKNEDDREIKRTILYVMVRGTWKVGDNGELAR